MKINDVNNDKMSTLRDILKNSEYWRKFKKIEKESEDILPSIRNMFNEYTNHDISHCKGVEELTDKMISEEVKQNLTYEEIFCLLSSIYLHDSGMIPSQEELDEFHNCGDKRKRDDLRENIRKNHHIRSENYILINKAELGLSKNESLAISKISKAHREIDINSLHNLPSREGEIRVPFLASVLRIGDECHITEDRVSKLFSKTVDPYLFEKHFRIHDIVTSIDFDKNKHDSIIMSGIVENEEELSIFIKSRNKILKELNRVKDILTTNNIPLSKIETKLELDALIQKRIIICLGNENDLEDDLELGKNEWISNKAIEENLMNLVSLKIVLDDGKTLNNNLEKFKYCVQLFFGTEKYNEFIETKYVEKCIKNLFPDIKHLYNAHFEDYEEKYRINLLVNSPSAVYLVLFWDKLMDNPYINIEGFQSANVLLDNMILLGFSYDLHNSKNLDSKELERSLDYILNGHKDKFKNRYILHKKIGDENG